MKVLHLVAGNLDGGAARGAYWLHQSLREINIDSKLLYSGRNRYSDDSVLSLSDSLPQTLKLMALNRLGKLPVRLYEQRSDAIFNTGFEGINFKKYQDYRDADIIHLHWINGLVSMRTLKTINKPIVWTMRDMWPMTGGCHYSMECNRYIVGCGHCPQLASTKKNDLSRLVIWNKKSSLQNNIQLIGISDWLTDCAKSSAVFKNFPIQTISNNIDTGIFFPTNKKIAREVLDLTTFKKIILIGAQNITDFYKGFDLFLNSLQTLDLRNIHFLFFGSTSKKVLDGLGIDYTNLGHLSDTVTLRLAYSAADVFVAPSRMEAFGKTLVEAMACNTPVVCFDATGPKDIVEHKISGYKAQPFEAEDLANGINWVLNLPYAEYANLCEAARARVKKCFDSPVIAKEYAKMYQKLLRRT